MNKIEQIYIVNEKRIQVEFLLYVTKLCCFVLN